ncbi:MAG: metallophosphoesterase [bacterium]
MLRLRMKSLLLVGVLLLPILQVGAAEKLFRFIAYGDTRDGHKVHQEIINQMIQLHPKFVISTGDLVNDGSEPALWTKFDKITGELRKTTPYYAALGNHDIGGEGFATRKLRPKNSGTEMYYSFDEGKLHFICLDTQQSIKPDSKQYKWLESDLKSAKSRGKFIIPFFHVAVYSVGGHGSSSSLQTILVPLYKKYGVKLSFQGHDHIYYRTLREGTTWVVTGGGGAPIYPIDMTKAIPGDIGATANHFCQCDVYSDKIVVTVYTPTLKKIDEFTIPFTNKTGK